jgi:hypothetical protein
VAESKVGANVMLELVNVRAVRADTVAAGRLIVIAYLVLVPFEA